MSGRAFFALLGVMLTAAVVRGDLVATPAEPGLGALQDNPLCQSQATSCSADCTSLIRCAFVTNAWQYISTAKCPSRTPYCSADGGAASCTATEPATGATCNPAAPQPLPAGSFNCTADGYWPDLSSCTRYYLCVGSSAYRFDCSAFPGTVYDQRTTHCVPKNRGTCYTYRCPAPNPNKPVEYHVYTPAPWIYAVCTGKDEAILGTCGEARRSVTQDGACVEACAQEGRFAPLDAKTGDTSSFVDCVDLGGGKLSSPTPGSCPAGTTFDASRTVGQCVVQTTP